MSVGADSSVAAQRLESMLGILIAERKFAAHRVIDHARSYAIGENYTNSIENAFSLLKRWVCWFSLKWKEAALR